MWATSRKCVFYGIFKNTTKHQKIFFKFFFEMQPNTWKHFFFRKIAFSENIYFPKILLHEPNAALGFEDEDNDSSAEISRATDWVRSASELGTLISLFDPTICLETETVTENWSDMEGKAYYYLDSSSASSGAVEFLCGAEVSNSSVAEDRDNESRWWWGLGVLIFCGVWIYYLDFLWGLEFLFGFSVRWWWLMIVGGWWLWVGGWVGWWVWVILGLCWVCERVPERRRGKEIIKNVKRINILLIKCVE